MHIENNPKKKGQVQLDEKMIVSEPKYVTAYLKYSMNNLQLPKTFPGVVTPCLGAALRVVFA